MKEYNDLIKARDAFSDEIFNFIQNKTIEFRKKNGVQIVGISIDFDSAKTRDGSFYFIDDIKTDMAIDSKTQLDSHNMVTIDIND